MQPLKVKLPLGHRTPFSVKDILDPTKFTKKISPASAGKTNQTQKADLEWLLAQRRSLSANYRKSLQKWSFGTSSSAWELQAGEEVPMSRQAWHED